MQFDLKWLVGHGKRKPFQRTRLPLQSGYSWIESFDNEVNEKQNENEWLECWKKTAVNWGKYGGGESPIASNKKVNLPWHECDQ